MCTSKDSAAVSEENSGCSGRVPKDSPVSARQDSEDVGLSENKCRLETTATHRYTTLLFINTHNYSVSQYAKKWVESLIEPLEHRFLIGDPLRSPLLSIFILSPN